jgi:hypothetical protein
MYVYMYICIYIKYVTKVSLVTLTFIINPMALSSPKLMNAFNRATLGLDYFTKAAWYRLDKVVNC